MRFCGFINTNMIIITNYKIVIFIKKILNIFYIMHLIYKIVNYLFFVYVKLNFKSSRYWVILSV